MMKKWYIALLVLAGMVIVSCGNPEKIEYHGVESVELKSFSLSAVTMEVGLRIENQSGTSAHLLKLDMVLTDEEGPIMGVTATDKVKLPRKSNEVVKIPLAVSMKQGLRTVQKLQAIESGGMSSGTVSGEIIVRYGMSRKKLEIPPMSINEFMRNYGVDISDMLK